MMNCAPEQFIGVPQPAAPVASKAGGLFSVMSFLGKTIGWALISTAASVEALTVQPHAAAF